MQNHSCAFARYCSRYPVSQCEGCPRANDISPRERVAQAREAMQKEKENNNMPTKNSYLCGRCAKVRTNACANCHEGSSFVERPYVSYAEMFNDRFLKQKSASAPLVPAIQKVVFSAPATIVFWADGTKTVVKCQGNDVYSKETGLAMAISKKALGNKGNYNETFHKWIPEEE